MRTRFSLRTIGFSLAALALTSSVNAATLWTGPNTNFTQTATVRSDFWTSRVIISRGQNYPIYNTVSEASANKIDSPKDTEWAFGTLANYNTLTYKPFYTFATATSPGYVAGGIIGKDAVCHLKTDDIYLQVHFTAWGSGFTGGFAYTRSTQGAVVPPTPTVSITNPTSGTVFSAPADIKISANASVSSGTVTNVSFYRGATLIGSKTTAPFTTTASNLTAGSYNLTAVATAGGISATSSVVTVSVVSATPVTLTTPVVANGNFSFNYSADAGLKYTVQSSTDLVNWNSGTTNTAGSSSVPFSESVVPNFRFYRVQRQSNP